MSEMRLVGEYGLRNKRELRIQEETVSKTKKTASKLIVTNDMTELIVRGRALLSNLQRMGVFTQEVDFNDLDDIKLKLEMVLDLSIGDFLSRRLQDRVYKLGMAVSVHQARFFINKRYIQVNGEVVNCPNYIVYRENEPYIQFSEKHNKMSKKKNTAAVEEPVEV